jgi:hypothetical protein
MRVFLSFALLASSLAAQAAEPPSADVAARVATAIALAQAPVTPQAPPATDNLMTWAGVLKSDSQPYKHGDAVLFCAKAETGGYTDGVPLSFAPENTLADRWVDGKTQVIITGRMMVNWDSRVMRVYTIHEVTPQAPAVIPSDYVQTQCYCDRGSIYCGCTPGACQCDDGKPCQANKPAKPLTGLPHLSFLVISKSACPPCERLRAELMAKWASDGSPDWDIWKDSPGTEAVYGGITAYPTILLLRDGKEVSRHVGYMSTADLLKWRDNPTSPQSRGKKGADYDVAVDRNYGGSLPNGGSADYVLRADMGGINYGAAVLSQPTYRPMMRYAAACSGSS